MPQTDPALQTRQLEALVQVSQLIGTPDLDEVLLQTLNLTREVVDAARGSFFLLDNQRRSIQRFIAARDMDPYRKKIVGHRVLDEGLAGWVIRNKQGVIVDDTAGDDRWLILDDGLRVRSALCVPYFIEGEVRGVMTLEHPEPHHFSPLDLQLARAVANQASVALRNAQLFDLITSKQRELETILTNISEALLVIHNMWEIKHKNPAAEAIFDTDKDNQLFQRLVDAIAISNMSSGSSSFELRDEQTRRDYSVNVAVLKVDDDPQQVDHVVALHDVTSLKDLNRLKTHMIQMASHDLKNPLGVLLGYMDMIKTDADSGITPDPAYVQAMYKAVTRMETLIASLLDAHRADQDSMMKRVPIDPNELIEASVNDMMPSITAHKHEFVQHIQPDLHPIKGDVVQLREALNNYLGNAIKYTPEGGKITLSVYVQEDRFYVVVSDNGRGIPLDAQQHIFEPYFRAPGTQHIEGTGIGLNLVKETIERHGGQVWFKSEENVGSTFGFWLPIF